MKLLILISFLIPSISVYAPILKHFHKGYIEVGQVSNTDYILQSIIQVESAGDSLAYNKKEKAAGIIQIRPVIIKDVNQILRKQGSKIRYRLKDRFNPRKSIEIYYVIQRHYSPSYDLKKVCKKWNGTGIGNE